MKTIKIIDLLKMYVDNRAENMPKKITYNNFTYNYTGLNYYNEEIDRFIDDMICLEDLEYPVEILDEEDEFEDIELDTSYYHDEPALIDDLAHTISLLIKNQKKIIERLENEKRN